MTGEASTRVEYVLVDDGTFRWAATSDFVPAIGTGVVDPDGESWRVVDVWIVQGGPKRPGVYALVERYDPGPAARAVGAHPLNGLEDVAARPSKAPRRLY